MLNGYTLGNEKLSRQRFANKYWKGGSEEFIYQFHTMEIEDGKDERQQLLINNDRALYKLVRDLSRSGRGVGVDNSLRVQKVEKAVRHLMRLQLFEIAVVILRLLLFLLKKK